MIKAYAECRIVANSKTSESGFAEGISTVVAGVAMESGNPVAEYMEVLDILAEIITDDLIARRKRND